MDSRALQEGNLRASFGPFKGVRRKDQPLQLIDEVSAHLVQAIVF